MSAPGWYPVGNGDTMFWDGQRWLPESRRSLGDASAYSPTQPSSSARSFTPLVTVLIIVGALVPAFFLSSIAAAIVIPIMLPQREKGYEAQVANELRNAAIAQEIYFTEFASYTYSTYALQQAGFVPSSGINLEFVTATDDSYCIQAQTTGSDATVFRITSTTGTVTQGTCP